MPAPLIIVVVAVQVVVVVVVDDVALATVPIKGTANVFCAVVDKQGNIADREEPMPL